MLPRRHLSVILAVLVCTVQAFATSYPRSYPYGDYTVGATAYVEATSYNSTTSKWTIRIGFSAVNAASGSKQSRGTLTLQRSGGQLAMNTCQSGFAVTWTEYTQAVPGETLNVSFNLSYWVGTTSFFGDTANYSFVVPAADAPDKKVLVSKFNNATYSVKYRVYSQPSGALIGEYVAPPNSGVSAYVTLAEGDVGAQVSTQALGVSQSGEVWSDTPGFDGPEVADPQSLAGVEDNGSLPSALPPSPTNPNNKPSGPGLPGSNQQPSQTPDGSPKPTVWTAPTPATTQGTTLDKDTFKQGVGKLEIAIGKIATGGGSSVDMTIANEKLTAINQRDTETKEANEAKAEEVQQSLDAEADLQTESALTTKVSSMATVARDKWNDTVQSSGLNDELPTTNGAATGGVHGTGGSDWPVVNFPVLGQIVFNPYIMIPWFIPYMNSAREVILWFLVVAFIKFGIQHVNEYCLGAARTPGANTTIAAQDLIPLAGQLLSWLKGAITVSIIMVVLVGAYGTAVLMLNSHITDFAPTAKAFISGVSPAASLAGSQSFWDFIGEAFPIKAFFQLAAAEVVLLTGMGVFYAGASTIVRAVRA